MSFNPLFIGAAFLTSAVEPDEERMVRFNPLFIGAAFLTILLAPSKMMVCRFQSPIHRGCFSDDED